MSRSWMIVFVGALAVAGCQQDKPEKKVDVETTEAPAAEEKAELISEEELPPLAPDDPETKVEGVAVAMDYAEEAEKTIAPENLEAELDRLEAEILE